MSFSGIPIVPLLLALVLSGHGLRKKSLSRSGAGTAFVVGVGMMAGGMRVFGVSLIVFYLAGSRATKYGKQRKAKLEDGYQEGGYRNGWQVLSNSAGALVACVLWNVMFAGESVQARVVGGLGTAEYGDGSAWCALDRNVGAGWSRMLLMAALGHFACCLGDTLASELGILSRAPPRLVTTWRVVPPGTNGGMSVGGTAASVAGGAVMGLTMGVCLVAENGACGAGAAMTCVGWGGFAGGFGSLVDSVLGATVQETRYSAARKVVVQDGSGGVVSGLNILTNNQVNVLASVVCAGLVGMLG